MKKENQLSRIKRVLEFVWNNKYSSFYRDKYKKAGINSTKNVKSMEDFKKLPFLTKEEIVKSDPYERLFLPLTKLSTIAISSGTTGGLSALSMVFKAKSSKISNKTITERTNKIKERRMMHLLPTIRAVQSSFPSDRVKLGFKGIDIAGDVANLPLSAKIATKLKVNAIHTTPTILYFFTPYLKKEYDLDNIQLISLGREPSSAQKAFFIKNNYKKANIVYSYGASEVDGNIGFYCKYLDSLSSQYFHPNPELYYEFIGSNDATELVLTNLISNMFPLIRYRTDDAAEMEDFNCKCHKKHRLKILGRINDDAFRIHGAVLYKDFIGKAILSFKSYLGSLDWQMHVFEIKRGGKIFPKLKLQLILNEKYKTNIKNMMEKGISDKLFLSPSKTLTDLVNEDVFLPLEIEFVESFPKTGGHRHIISHMF